MFSIIYVLFPIVKGKKKVIDIVLQYVEKFILVNYSELFTNTRKKSTLKSNLN